MIAVMKYFRCFIDQSQGRDCHAQLRPVPVDTLLVYPAVSSVLDRLAIFLGSVTGTLLFEISIGGLDPPPPTPEERRIICSNSCKIRNKWLGSFKFF